LTGRYQELKKVNYLVLVVLIALIVNLSCSGSGGGWNQDDPPTRGDSQKLQEALASREQENPPPLTVLQAYQIAQARATEWNAESYLEDMRASVTDELPYYFNFSIYNPSKGFQCEKRRSDIETLSISIDRYSGEIKESSIGYPGMNRGRIDPNTWIIDSPQALEIADANGGRAFREKYPDCSVGIGADGVVKKWQIGYREGYFKDKVGAFLQVLVDPYTGEVTISEDTEGISKEKENLLS
jgi:hypothetical protein